LTDAIARFGHIEAARRARGCQLGKACGWQEDQRTGWS
jgi:hypothetical protein